VSGVLAQVPHFARYVWLEEAQPVVICYKQMDYSIRDYAVQSWKYLGKNRPTKL